MDFHREMETRWPRAWGDPRVTGVLRGEPEHFQVEEQLDFEPSGSGEHRLLQIRKRGENTLWIAKQLARLAGVKPRDVGYAGLKDRNAVTTQWFSVGMAGRAEPDWTQLNSPSVEVLAVHKHHRKLRSGALAQNRFRIQLSSVREDAPTTDEHLARLGASGVPNYFGEQRFGRSGDNVQQAIALFAGTRKVRDRKLRGIYLSAARSWIFNEILSKRIAAGTWNRVVPGDVLGLDGRSAVFAQHDTPDEEIVQRCERLDVHPTGALWGVGELMGSGSVRDLEMGIASDNSELARGLERAGLKQERRALRLRVSDLGWERCNDTLQVSFSLRSGSYATSVLREIASYTLPESYR